MPTPCDHRDAVTDEHGILRCPCGDAADGGVIYGEVTGHRADAQAPRYAVPASGYGADIPTRHWVQLNGYGARWRRVYAMQFGNAASLYVRIGGRDLFLRDADLASCHGAG